MSSNDQDIYGHALKLAGPEQAALTGATQVCLRKEVQFHTGGKRDQLEPRVLVLTTTRCYLLSSRQHGRTEIAQQFHFLRLSRIESPAAKQLIFYLNGDNQPRKFNLLVDNDCVEVTAAIVSQLRNVLPSAPKEQLVAMQFEPSNRKQQLEQLLMQLQDVMQPIDMSNCGGYVTTYGFLVDYFSCPFREEVSWDIDNIYVSHGFKQLNLADFHHLDSKELQPIILALKYNLYFDGLIEKNFKLSNESFDTISQVFLTDLSLKTLTLDNVGLRSDDLMKLSNNISLNKKTALTHLDLSNNHLDDKGFELLAGALEGLPHGLVIFSLANCALSSRAAGLLSSAMLKNSHFASSLNKMDWSGNALGPDSMAALAFLQGSNSVAHLNLSNCQLLLETVLPTLRRGCCQHLSHLNLNANNKPVKKRSNAVSGKTINEFFSKVIAMETILMNNCKLPVEAAIALLKGINSNPNIIKITLDMGANELGTGNVKDFATVLTKSSTLHSLDISDNGLDAQMDYILKAVLPNTSLKHLSIGKNFTRLKNPNVLLSNLVTLINTDTAKLESLSLADSKLRDHTITLLDGLGINQCVTTLDISGNEMGDRGARSLAKLLLVNNTLHTISWDHNLTGLAGFEDVSNALEHNCTMRSMPTPLSDTLRMSRDAGVEAAVQHIQQLLFRNHSPDRSMVELASRRNKYTHITSSRQQELDRSLVQLEDLLTMIPKESLAEPSVQHARNVKEEAYKVSQLMVGLYPPKVEAEQVATVTEQMKAVARPLQHKLFQEQILENSERMVSLCDKTCPTIFGQPEAKQSLRDLIVTTKDDSFLDNELVTVATQAVTTCISGRNLTTSSAIGECVFEQVLSTLDECIEQLVPLKHTEMTDAPQQKPKPVSFRVKRNQKEKEKERSKTVSSPKDKPDKLPELVVEAPIKNVTITKNRVQRPARTHRVTRPSRLPETSDITDAPSLSTVEEVTPNATPSPAKSPSPTTKSPVSLSPIKSPSLTTSTSPANSPSLTKSPSPNISSSSPSFEIPAVPSEPAVEEVTSNEDKRVTEEKEVEDKGGDKKQDDQAKQVDAKESQLRESVIVPKEEKSQLKDNVAVPKEEKKQPKGKEKEDKKLQKEKEKEEKRLQKEREKEEKRKQKEREKEEKKQQKNARKVSKQPGAGNDEKELLEASTDKRSSLRKSMELSTSKAAASEEALADTESPADAVKKVPPPTKAKPKPPTQEAIKIPVLPPNAAIASSTLANVLKEGRKQTAGDKKAPPSVAKKPGKKPDDQVDEDKEQEDKDEDVKVEEDKKAPPSVAKKPGKKPDDQVDGNKEQEDKDEDVKVEEDKKAPPSVAKRPGKKPDDQVDGDKEQEDKDKDVKVEEDKKAPPSVAKKPGKKPDDQVDGDKEQEDKDEDVKVEEDKKAPPSVAKKPPKKENQDDTGGDKGEDDEDKEEKKASPPTVAKKPRKKEADSQDDTGGDKVEEQHVNDVGKGEDEKTTPPTVAKKPSKKEDEEKDESVDTAEDKDNEPVTTVDDDAANRAADEPSGKVEEDSSEDKVADGVDNDKATDGADKMTDDKAADNAEAGGDKIGDDTKELDRENSIGPNLKVVSDDDTSIL